LARRTNIRDSKDTHARFKKPYINTQEYPDFMRIVPAQYVYKSNPNIPHSLYKKPYAEYSTDYQAMELTWNQDPVVINWRPDWDWLVPEIVLPEPEVEQQWFEPMQSYLGCLVGSASSYSGTTAWNDVWFQHDNANYYVAPGGCPEVSYNRVSTHRSHWDGGGSATIHRSCIFFDMSHIPNGTIFQNAYFMIEPVGVSEITAYIQYATYDVLDLDGDDWWNTYIEDGPVKEFTLLGGAEQYRVDLPTGFLSYLNDAVGGYATFMIRAIKDYKNINVDQGEGGRHRYVYLYCST